MDPLPIRRDFCYTWEVKSNTLPVTGKGAGYTSCVPSVDAWVRKTNPSALNWSQFDVYRWGGILISHGPTAEYLHNYGFVGWDAVQPQVDGSMIRYMVSAKDGKVTPWRKENVDGTLYYFRELPFDSDVPGNTAWKLTLDYYRQTPRKENRNGTVWYWDDAGQVIRYDSPDGTVHVAPLVLNPSMDKGFDNTKSYDLEHAYVFSPEYWKANTIDDAKILSLSPAVAAQLYYGLLDFQMVGRHPRLIASDYFCPGCLEAEAYVRERGIRNRVYALRTDLHFIKDLEGNTIPGLIPPDQFPAYNGLRDEASLGEQIGTGVALAVVSFIPVLGMAISVANYARQLNDMLRAKESLAQIKEQFANPVSDALPVLLADTKPTTTIKPPTTPISIGEPAIGQGVGIQVEPVTPSAQLPVNTATPVNASTPGTVPAPSQPSSLNLLPGTLPPDVPAQIPLNANKTQPSSGIVLAALSVLAYLLR